ncbi:MAG TPA: D-alanine--D-alanine ligase family protein [Pseudonocardiaceae bacterium]|jgi:D-alanine-D-alanine ligase|nr:D-alanine--D-alanine ligase family protein [Pseudonocardiaceae bacterium]
MPEGKIRLAVLFGGRSGEHEVSRKSAASIMTYLDRQKYDIVPVYIDKRGSWTSTPTVPELETVDATWCWQESAFPTGGDQTVLGSLLAAMATLATCDLVFPVLHGPFGEDGTVQALLEQFGIPYVGNGVLASALSMDKEYTKKIAISAGLTVNDGVVLRGDDRDLPAARRDRLGLPVFVKPAREGSSIGVSRVDNWPDLPTAVDSARHSDTKVLVEAAAFGREIDIGVLERPGGELEVSPALEIHPSNTHDFFDYRAKYDDHATVFDLPADLDPEVARGLAQDAVRMFQELGCTGLLRVDFFVTPDGRRILNEVNTFPGFTSASQYPRMWQAVGLSYRDLLDIVIATARWRAGQRSPQLAT